MLKTADEQDIHEFIPPISEEKSGIHGSLEQLVTLKKAKHIGVFYTPEQKVTFSNQIDSALNNTQKEISRLQNEIKAQKNYLILTQVIELISEFVENNLSTSSSTSEQSTTKSFSQEKDELVRLFSENSIDAYAYASNSKLIHELIQKHLSTFIKII